MAEKSYVRAKETFATALPAKGKNSYGAARMVSQGDLFSATDPLVKKNPHLFETVEDIVDKKEA